MLNSSHVLKRIFCSLFLFVTTITFAAIKPIPVNQAFKFSAQIQNQQLQLHWDIAPKYELYRQRIDINPIANSKIAFGPVQLPDGLPRYDKILGHYQIYQGQLNLSLPILNYQVGEFRVQVNYQGCSTEGYCYPPQQRIIILQISQFAAQIQSIENAPVKTTIHNNSPPKSKNLLLLLLSFFGFGLLLAFTPCVLPMIPILSSIIIGQKRSLKQAFLLSLTYVIAMAIAYAIAGLIAGLLGSNIQATLQTPWVIIVFVLLFVILSLSLFGLYELRLPNAWNNKLNALNQRQKSGSFLGVAVMGVLSVLIVSPCISAPLVAALAYISQAGHAATGGLILFVMGLGMGTPLLIICTLGGKFLPKTGEWMNNIKIIFGVLLLITAVWLLYRLLPANICLILWGLIAIISAGYLIYLSLQKRSSRQSRIKHITWQTILGLWLIFGIMLFIGGSLGNQDPLHPLSSPRSQHHLTFSKIKTVNDLQQTLNKAHGKIVMLDFYADWCVACKLMEYYIFNQPDVQTPLKNIVLLRADVTKNDTDDKALEKYLNVFAPPTIIFFDKNGQEIPSARIVGEVSKKAFMAKLRHII